MQGNVFEWMQDSWHSDYNGAPSDGSAWENGDSNLRVARAGSWFYFVNDSRSASRRSFNRDTVKYDIGFRLTRDL